MFKAIKISFISVALCSCATLPPIQQPLKISASEVSGIYRSPLLDRTDHTLQHLNSSKDVLYSQNYGGGGVGVGVLLGPLGVAANMKAIESNTMKDVGVLKNSLNIKPLDNFIKAAGKSNLAIKVGAVGGVTKFDPYVLIEKTEGDVIMLASALMVEEAGSAGKIQYKYLVQLPKTYSIAELSKLSAENIRELDGLIEDGFSSLIARIQSESSANLQAEESVTVISEFLTPRFKFEMAGSLIEQNSSYSWVRVIGGIYGVRNADIQVKRVKAKK